MRENIITLQLNSPRTTKLYFRMFVFHTDPPSASPNTTKRKPYWIWFAGQAAIHNLFSEIKFLNIFTGGHKLISIANTILKA